MHNPAHSQLLVATTNPGKLREYQVLLANLPYTLLALPDVGITTALPETGDTYTANAQLKAVGYAEMSGLITLADDSGLEVAALNGAPGVHSARYGGEGLTDVDRTNLLLQELGDTPFHERLARFVCVIAVATPGGRVEFAEGSVPGVIDFAPRGTNGFGYDPVFYVVDRGVTMAELSPAEKDQISHRAQAARKIRLILPSFFGDE